MSAYPVCSESDVVDGDKRLVAIDAVEIGLFRIDNRILAWRNLCPHQGGPVCQGQIFRRVVDDMDADGQARGRRYHDSDRNIVCPWHGAEFDIRTGRHAGTARLSLVPVTTECRDGLIYVHIDAEHQ